MGMGDIPVSGRARVEGGKLPPFGEPRTRRGFCEQYHAARQKGLLDAGIVRRGRWASIVFPLPEADCAFVDSKHSRKFSLRHAGESPRRAQLAIRDEIVAPVGHEVTRYLSCDTDSVG
jgi:hypothetical protein